MIEKDSVVRSFGNEWTKFDQSKLSSKELKKVFNDYFDIFPWKKINKNSVGFDMGCGSGRWAKLVAYKVGFLNCVEPSMAIKVAKKNLKQFKNIKFINSKIEHSKLKIKSQDFGYCLGVSSSFKKYSKKFKFLYISFKKKRPFFSLYLLFFR